MTGYVRVDTSNNIADGNVISAADLDNEFDGIQAAFNASTGHNHDGTTGEGAPISVLGPTQDVVVGASTVTPKTTNTVDIGSSSLKFKDLYLAGNASIGGTLAVTGATTLSAALTYGGVTLSNAVTGTGNMVLSASPTLTGTLSGANASLSGTLAVTGVATLTAQPILSSLTASRAVFTDGSKGLVSNAITGTGNVVMSASPTLTGTITAEALTTSSTVTLNGGTANGVAYLNGSKVLTTGSALTFDGTNFATTGSGTLKNLLLSGGTLPGAGNPSIALRSSDNVVYHQSGSANSIVMLDSAQNTMQSINATAQIWNISNAEQMRLTSTGLGIGTSSPSVKLDVAGGAKLTGTVVTTTGSDAFSAGSGTGTSIRVNALFKGTDASGNARTSYIGTNIYGTDGSMEFGNNVAGLTMSIAPGGNVGIGTSSPQGKLSVSNGTIFVGSESNTTQTNNLLNGYGYRIGTTLYGNVSVRSTYSQVTNAASLEFYVGSTGTTTAEAMRITSAGNLGIGTSAPSGVLQAIKSGANLVIGDGGTSLNRFDANTQIFRTGSFAETMRIDGSGNVGIGTSSPANKLSVTGSTGTIASFTNGATADFSIICGASATSLNAGGANILAFQTGGSERARIDSSGNLIQTVNTTAATLATNNTLTFSIVDNSTLRISVRGSDGTTRTATVALS